LDEPGQDPPLDAGELAEALARVRAVAREIRGPLGLLIANLGFALEEISSLRAELNPTTAPTGENLVARLARAQGALSAVGDALREARNGAEQVKQLSRDLTGGPSESSRTHSLGRRRASWTRPFDSSTVPSNCGRPS